jgi:uncharacterized membrane protein
VTKDRLQAFSDGVIAIIITIMVLELRPPAGISWASLTPLSGVFVSYILSFLYVGIYWNNHHHMLHAAQRVNGRILWANLHLLFWLSLFPFVTAWSGQNNFAAVPMALYGVVLFMAGAAYYLLSQALIRHHGRDSLLAQAVGRDSKGILSMVMYAAAVPLALLNPWIAFGLYAFVALIWVIPDSRIEKVLKE